MSKLFNKSFVLLWLGETAFDIGAALLGFALGVWVFEKNRIDTAIYVDSNGGSGSSSGSYAYCGILGGSIRPSPDHPWL